MKKPCDGLLTTIYVIIFLLLMFLLMHVATGNAQLQPAITEARAMRCIIGEAENQGYKGMLAVACGLRNRGTTKGVYGCDHKRKVGKRYIKEARRAWRESKHNRIHSGTHWEAKHFKVPYWVKSMVKVFEYKDHVFYKEKGR